MGIIKKLPPNVTNKIAAGEVVERPAAVVKELIENSIDAGSTNVEVFLIEGGKERIQIVDNGKGFARDDLEVSLERFSTSKIEMFEDLENLMTFGFRGEALASIASISLLDIKSRAQDEQEGTYLRAEGGEIIEIKSAPWTTGTSITVNNLFFNTPARRKFQKNALSESRQIYRVFRYFALAYPELGFSLHNDGRCIWRLQNADLRTRISEIFDPKIVEKLSEISFQDSLYNVSGFISVPEWTRSTRIDQYLFVNNRYIKNRTVEHGVYHGYGTALAHGAGHPFFVLKLELEPNLFDINVHPTKLEARFRDDRGMHRFISKAVQNGLGIPEWSHGQQQTASRIPVTGKTGFSNNIQVARNEENPEHGNGIAQTSFQLPLIESGSNNPEIITAHGDENVHLRPSLEHEKVWQVHNCYIFSQVKSGLIILDQHVAHERILYEKARRRLQGGEKPSQQLLFPETIHLTRDELVIINELLNELKQLGFEISITGNDAAAVKAVPLEIRQGREIKALKDIIEEYQKDEYKDLSIHERLAASFACRSAIMKGDKLTVDEMYRLIDDLFATEMPYYCPHGRPTVIDLSLIDINSKFKR
ncbi:DNA mismatch repair endonuclease MutL [candidate division KSB1 bacterium]